MVSDILKKINRKKVYFLVLMENQTYFYILDEMHSREAKNRIRHFYTQEALSSWAYLRYISKETLGSFKNVVFHMELKSLDTFLTRVVKYRNAIWDLGSP